ncbi:MAG: cytochrome b6-f complex subunit 6 [Cyanobacteria bacterium P01_F01_bin.4]
MAAVTYVFLLGAAFATAIGSYYALRAIKLI